MAILNNKIPTNLTEYPNSFKRQGSFPLEAYSIFYTLADAKTYAKDNPVAYVGQIITVVENNKTKLYQIIDTDGTLQPFGDIADLTQTPGEEIIIDCGSAPKTDPIE